MLTVLCQLYGARKFVLGDGKGFSYLQVQDDIWAITYDDVTYADMSHVRNKSSKKIMDTYLNSAYAGHIKSLCKDWTEVQQIIEEDNIILIGYKENEKCFLTNIWTRFVASIKSLVNW